MGWILSLSLSATVVGNNFVCGCVAWKKGRGLRSRSL